jgi:hypothetical protein
MGLLGILSLLQITIIPGLLITALIKSLNQKDRVLLVIPLSCIVNYFLVIILTVLGIYTQTSVLLILFVEVVALFLYSKNRLLQGAYAIDPGVLIDIDKKQNGMIRWLVILLVFFYIVLTFKQFGTVFTDADAVVSWNKWAIDWFNGISPRSTFHYPQLIPALYSLTYQFIGSNEVDLFAKLVPAFFPLMMMLTFLRMASLDKKESTIYLLMMILFWFTFSRMMGSHFAFNGYVDLPLAYFVLVAIYIFKLARVTADTGQSSTNIIFLLLCSIVIAGAAITKHSALYLAAIMPLAWYFHFRNVTSIRQVIFAYLVILFVAGHWFIYKQIQIFTGADHSNLQYLSEIVELPWYAKLWHGITMISSKISWLWIPLLFAGLLTPLGRAHAVWIFIPFFLLWALFASYDFRNLILALPSLAFILASGMIKLHEYFTQSAARTRLYRGVAKFILLLFVAIFMYLLSTPKIATDLIALNTKAKRAVGDLEFNENLYAFFEMNPEPAKIASNYYGLSYLPGLKERDLPASCSQLDEFAEDSRVRFLIIEGQCPEETLAKVASKYKLRFKGQNEFFYEIIPENLEMSYR